MYERILIPLDGSALSEMVLPYALVIAETFNSDIDLVCAVEHEDIPEHVVEQDAQEKMGYLEGIADTLPDKFKVLCFVEEGHPAEVIIDHSRDHAGTLITMATHGYSGLQRWVLGSVAHKVVQAANSPVLLLPAGAKSPEGGPVQFERVVIPLDGSPVAESILPHVLSLCDGLNLELILIRAYLPRFPGSTVRMHEVSEIVHDAAESYIRAKTEQIKQRCQGRVSYRVLRGVPAEQITDFALETPNSLTAMSTHGRHGVGRWVLGSVTDAVIHSSEEPVLVVRAPQELQD